MRQARAPDLVRSPLVNKDLGGDLIAPVIRDDRPDKGARGRPHGDAGWWVTIVRDCAELCIGDWGRIRPNKAILAFGINWLTFWRCWFRPMLQGRRWLRLRGE
jgi:hypothetical protein